MAFTKVTTDTQYKKATALAEGESFMGYYLYEEISDRGFQNMIFLDESGNKIYFSPAGNLKYLEKNKTPLRPGFMTKLTRKGERMNKKGQKVGVYDVEQDFENKTTAFTDEQLTAMNYKDTSTQAAVAAYRA